MTTDGPWVRAGRARVAWDRRYRAAGEPENGGLPSF